MTYILIIILLFLLELSYFKVAKRFNIVDEPNERSSHLSKTLRGGGIVFYFGILLYFLFWGLNYPYFFIGLTLICLISFIDDVSPVSFGIRLIFHLIAMLFMFYQWGLFTDYSILYLSMALIFCTGMINAYNFMDGINGITGGYSFVMLVVLAYINHAIVPGFMDPAFIYVALVSVAVFVFFNFRKNAKCFAGDVGAVGIAFIIVFILGKLILNTGDLTWIILMVLYGVDSILTITRRIFLKENIFQPHRKHVYQILVNKLGFSHVKVSFLYMGVQMLINCVFIFFALSHSVAYFWIVVSILCVGYVLFIYKYGRESVSNKKNVIDDNENS